MSVGISMLVWQGVRSLEIWTGRAVPAATTASVQVADPNTEYITYQVREGDSLWEIARKYPGVSEADISRLNNITNASRIRPGQVLKIKPKS